MEIFAGLVSIGEIYKIPLPWYNRPALSLRSGTSVYAVQVFSKDRLSDAATPPDILLTPLEPSRLKNVRSFTIDIREGIGAIGQIIQDVSSDCNIDLMETVTIDQRTTHRVNFIIQPKHSIQDRVDFNQDDFYKDLVSIIESEGKVQIRQNNALAQNNLEFANQKKKNVVNLRVNIDDLMQEIKLKYDNADTEFDFTKIVISSNTESRFIRCIFPKKGAFQLSITHLDRPNAIETISECLSNLKYNVLLSRTSKVRYPNAGHSNDAESVLVCEPDVKLSEIIGSLNLRKIRREIEDSLRNLDGIGNFNFNLGSNALSYGIDPEKIISAKNIDRRERIVRVPYESERDFESINIDRNGKKRIFVSMRSVYRDDGCLRSIRDMLIDEFETRNIELIDGFSVIQDGSIRNVTENEIFARIWSCDAAIFIAGGVKPEFLTDNQRIEWAFSHALFDRKVNICHNSKSDDKIFMMPRESKIIFRSLDHADKLRIQSEIGSKLDLWFR